MTARSLLLVATLFVVSLATIPFARSQEVQIICITGKALRISVADVPDPHLMLNFCGPNSGATEANYKKAEVRLRLNTDPLTVQVNAGGYNHVDPWVYAKAAQTKLTMTSTKVVKAHLLSFESEWLETHEILQVMQRDGLVPASLEHLLALGIARPELQEQYHIVVFGTAAVRETDPSVIMFPVLGAVDGQRYLTRIEATAGETRWPYNLRLFAPPTLLAKMDGDRIRAVELAYDETLPMPFAFLAVSANWKEAKEPKPLEFKPQ